MENNNPVTPQPAVPQTPPQTPISESSSGDSNKMILWLVIGLVIIVLVVGGIYIFLSRQQAATPQSQTATSQTPAPQEDLEGDLNKINVDTGTNSDFDSLDQDLQQL